VVPRSIPIILPMATASLAYKYLKTNNDTHNDDIIILLECLTVNG
jgi:hypothetical protein